MDLRNRVLIASVVTVAAAVLVVGRQASGQAPDAVAVSPQLYTVRLENTYVRVLEYRSQSRKAGDVIWRGATTHAAENIWNADGHYLWVEFKVPVATP
jgi:hypothetical protein